jgi:hypothetical protein
VFHWTFSNLLCFSCQPALLLSVEVCHWTFSNLLCFSCQPAWLLSVEVSVALTKAILFASGEDHPSDVLFFGGIIGIVAKSVNLFF